MKQIMTKDDKAVSPIIATILLIAITVVLAATLVTILGGFTHGASGSASTAAASTQFSSTNNGTKTGNTTAIFLNVTSFSASNVSSSKIAITLTVTNTTATYTYTGYLTSGSTLTANDSSTAKVSGPTYFTAGSSYIITINGVKHTLKTTSVTVQLVYSGSVIYKS